MTVRPTMRALESNLTASGGAAGQHDHEIPRGDARRHLFREVSP